VANHSPQRPQPFLRKHGTMVKPTRARNTPPPGSNNPLLPAHNEPQPMAAAGTAQSPLTPRRNSDQLPFQRVPADALLKIGQHLPPKEQGRFSLLNKDLFKTMNAAAKEAMKTALTHELKTLCLHSLSEDKKIDEMVIQTTVDTIKKLSADDQMDVLVPVLKTMQNPDYNFEKSALRKSTCMKLLAQAALKIKSDHTLQMEALKLLTNFKLMTDNFKHGGEGAQYESPWNASDMPAVFDFAKQAFQTESYGFVEYMNCLVGINFSATKVMHPTAFTTGVNELLDIMTTQVVKNRSATLACDLKNVELQITPRNPLIYSLLWTKDKLMKSTDVQTVWTIDIKIRLMQIYNQYFIKFKYERESPDPTELQGQSSGKLMPLSLALAVPFFDSHHMVAIGESAANPHISANRALHYLAAMNINWFPKKERPERLAQLLGIALQVAENKNLSLGQNVSLPLTFNGWPEASSLTEEYSAVIHTPNSPRTAAVSEARDTLEKINSTIKKNILIKFSEFKQKLFLTTQEANDLSLLIIQKPAIFDQTEIKAMKVQLFDLLFKVSFGDPQLPHLVHELDLTVEYPPGNEYKSDPLKVWVTDAIASKATTFSNGARLLTAYDIQLKKLNTNLEQMAILPEVEELMKIHFSRPFNEKINDTTSWCHKTQNPYFDMIEVKAEKINYAILKKTHTVLEKKMADEENMVDKILNHYLPTHTSDGKPVDANRWCTRPMSGEEADSLMHLTEFTNSSTEIEKDQVLRLFTEGVLPPAQFMNMASWFSELSQPEELPRLTTLVAAVEKFEHKYASDMTDFKISPSAVFLMTKNILEIIGGVDLNHPDPRRSILIEKIKSIEQRHIARLNPVAAAN
jgi:hypothetical protein